MKATELKEYFPAGGKSTQEIEISDIQPTGSASVVTGYALLPERDNAEKVVIYQLSLADNSEEYRLIPASCPHKGADISQDELKPDGNIYCSIHRRPICIYSEYNQAYAVEKRDSHYFIIKS